MQRVLLSSRLIAVSVVLMACLALAAAAGADDFCGVDLRGGQADAEAAASDATAPAAAPAAPADEQAAAQPAAVTAAPTTAPAPAAAAAQLYAETPEELTPYRKMGKAYFTYFLEQQPYRGAGREKPEPQDLKSIKIGLIAPVNYEYDSPIGQAMLNGSTLAIEQANAAGGFRKNGPPYEILLRNDDGLWGSSSNTFVELAYDQKVWGVVGSVDGSNTHIALRVALKAETMLIVTASTDPTMNETNIPWIMRTNPDDRQFGYKLSQVIYKDKGHRKVAILRVNDTYGRKGATEFKDASRRLGYPIVLEVRYALQDTDYATQIERVRKSGADAVVLWSSPYHAARIVQQMQAMNLGLPVYGADRLVCNAFIEQAGPAAENVIAVGGLDPNQDTEMWEDFRAAFVERFGTQPDAFAAYTYDGTKMLIDSLERVGLNRAKVRDDLYSLTTYDGVSGRMRFDSTLANLGQAHAMQVREGRWVPYQPQQ